MTRSSMNNSIILVTRHNSVNMIKERIRSRCTYWAFADGDAMAITSGADGVTTVLQTEHSRQRWRWRFAATPDLTEDEPVVKILSTRVRCFPETLFALSRCRIPKVNGSRDLLSNSPMHAGARNGENYGGGAVARRDKTLTQIRLIFLKVNRSYIYESPWPRVVRLRIRDQIRKPLRLSIHLVNIMAQ